MSDESPLKEDAIILPASAEPAEPAAPVSEAAPVSPAMARFTTCRWRREEDGQAAHCTHRDVITMAGVSGFVPDAWCGDCAYFKVKRVARRPSYQW